MRGLKNTKGITLVALIITIIVLLILAMVSISLVMNSGIIDKADQSVKTYSDEEIQEKIKIAYSEYQMAQYSGQKLSLDEALTNSGLTEKTISGEGPWTIIISTEQVYTLSKDGTITDGSTNNATGGNATGGSINYSEGGLLERVIDFSSTYVNILGGQEISQQFVNEWRNLLLQQDFDDAPECNSLKKAIDNIEQIIISQNVNTANGFDQIMPQILSSLNGVCSQYGFAWGRDNSTRIWTYNYL